MHDLFELVSGFLTLGGPVVSILLTLSVLAFTLVIMKLAQYWRARVGIHGSAREAADLWHAGHQTEAMQLLDGKRGLVDEAASMSMVALRHRALHKDEIEEAVSLHVAERMHSLQSGFRAMDSIAQIAPLLGLFGTVLGMITAFQRLQEAGDAVDPSILAGGIWVALLTTAVGLAVAMPVSLVLTWFESRLENERVAVETIIGKLLNRPLAVAEDASAETADMAGLAHAH